MESEECIDNQANYANLIGMATNAFETHWEEIKHPWDTIMILLCGMTRTLPWTDNWVISYVTIMAWQQMPLKCMLTVLGMKFKTLEILIILYGTIDLCLLRLQPCHLSNQAS